ncbi:MAG: tetratricopeptide repeat protein, partial [Bacteroidetes bacterium]|nr:tetratricopeptide repeat protein [Bacteroidota bacterium]
MKIGFLIVFLSLFPRYHSVADTAMDDSFQKQFAALKGADKITLLSNVAGKALPGDSSFLKSGIKSLVSNPTLLKEKGSLDALSRLVNVLSGFQAVGLARPLVYAGARAASEQGDYGRAFLFELAFSDLFFDMNKADSAADYLSKASEIVNANNLKSQEHVLMNRRARIAELQGRKLEALDLFLQAARLYQAQNKQTELAVIYDNIGTLHIGLNNLAEAVKYLKMANAINQKPGLENQRNSNYINLGIAYKEYDSLQQAELWYKKSIALSRQLNDEFQLARVYLNLGNTERRLNDYAQAKILYDSSLYFCRKLNNDYGVLLNTINLGEWRLLRKEYRAALEQLKTAEKKLKSYKLPVETEEVSRLLSAVYEATGDDHAALKYFKAHVALKDSIEGAETKRSILELQARYEQERSAKEIASLNEAVMKGKASTRLYIIFFIIIIVALMTVGT